MENLQKQPKTSILVSAGFILIITLLSQCFIELKGEVRRKMNFTYMLGFVVLRDVVKVFQVSSSSFVRKTTGRNQARSHSGA